MNTRLAVSFGLMTALLVTSGCGYTTRSSLDEKYQTIFVSAFQNLSREYDLQAPPDQRGHPQVHQ